MSEVRAGDIIAGKFQIDRVLGEGGMGYVVAARHLQLGQMVALKFMRQEVCNDEYKSRFLREARNTVRLKSKHVSRVLDVGSLEGGTPYMVMEYLDGTDLSALLQKRGPFPVAEACDYIIQACEAIAEAHGHGIVHRDLKPANLFLTRGSGGEPVVKVLDFGVSKVLHLGIDAEATNAGRRHPDSVVTKASDLLGSPSYMAPEQVVSARDADSRSDVWSLGVILFRLISGKAPFSGASLGELIQNIMHGPMPNLRDFRPDLPEGLEHVLLRCMERDRARRIEVVELARLLAPYAGPNAAPSLERIAILGPALVTLTPRTSTNPPASFTGGQSNWSAPPAMAAVGGRRDPKAAFLPWVIFTVFMVGVAALFAKKGWPPWHGQSEPAPSANGARSGDLDPPAPVEFVPQDPPVVSAGPAPVLSTPVAPTGKTATPSTRPHSQSGHGRIRTTPRGGGAGQGTAPASDIPHTRE